MSAAQRLVILFTLFLTFTVIKCNPEGGSIKNVNCQNLPALRERVNQMNDHLLNALKNDFSNILKRIMENNKKEVYQTFKVLQNEIDKIINDSQKTKEQKRKEAEDNFKNSRGFMDNSYDLLRDISQSLVDEFAKNVTMNNREINRILAGN